MYVFLYVQGMNDMDNATKFYKDVLHQDNMNIEAIACIATHYFYTDQPEIALKFYRYTYNIMFNISITLFKFFQHSLYSLK